MIIIFFKKNGFLSFFSLEGRKEEVFGSSYCIILGFFFFFLIAFLLFFFVLVRIRILDRTIDSRVFETHTHTHFL